MKYIAFIILAFAFTTSAAADDISQWVEKLDHASYEQRELAVANLVKAGEAAIPRLMQVTEHGGEESRWRAFLAIKRIIGKNSELRDSIIADAKMQKVNWLAGRLTPRPSPPANVSVPVFGSFGGGKIFRGSSSRIIVRSSSSSGEDYSKLIKLIEESVDMGFVEDEKADE